MSKAFWKAREEDVWQIANVRHKGKLRIAPKTSALWLWYPLSILLKIVTLGRGPWLVDEYYTTIGRTMYTPGDGSSWKRLDPYSRFGVLRHELAHFDDMYFGDPDIHGALLDDEQLVETSWWYRFMYGVKYLFYKLPFKYATFRQQVEYGGYIQQARQNAYRDDGVCSDTLKLWLYEQFTSPTYGWMAADKDAVALVERMVAQIEAEYKDGTLERLLFGDTVSALSERRELH